MRQPVRSTLLLTSVVVLAALLSGCPSSQEGPRVDAGPTSDGGTGDGGDGDGGGTTDGGGMCTAVPTCSATIRYTGTGNVVILRGDFEADGWTVGIPMTKNGAAWEATIPVRDGQTVLYKLVVDGNWIADPGNPKGSPDGFGQMNSVLRVDCDNCPKRAPIDWRDAILYFVMLDRFKDGDTSNNMSLGLERPADYQGGDLKGLTQKIEEGYFESLGVNALWITSPFDNANMAGRGSDGHDYSGYHGYWPRDLEAVESHVGTLADLKAMVAAAHAHGLQVVIDYVMNHVHSESPVYAQHRDWFWPNDNGRGGDCVCGGGCNWDDAFDRKRCWFTSYLPDFDFRNGDARRWSVSNAIKWAKEAGVDGFRLDAVKHIEDDWLTDLRARLEAEVRDNQVFYLVGETYTGDRPLIKYYVRPDTMLDGQFDFPLRAVILATVLRRTGSMNDLAGFLGSNDSFYGPGAVMSTFIGNHDVPRVIGFAEDQPLWGSDWDDGKARAWNNRPGLPSSSRPFERLAVAYTLLFTSPGVPLIYYGDELGLPGGGDPDNRRFMPWSGLTADQTNLRAVITRLAHVRRDHAALRRGTRTIRGATQHTLVYQMQAPGDDVFVALNRDDVAQAAQGLPAGDYDDLVNGGMVRAPLSIPPRTGLVLRPR